MGNHIFMVEVFWIWWRGGRRAVAPQKGAERGYRTDEGNTRRNMKKRLSAEVSVSRSAAVAVAAAAIVCLASGSFYCGKWIVHRLRLSIKSNSPSCLSSLLASCTILHHVVRCGEWPFISTPSSPCLLNESGVNAGAVAEKVQVLLSRAVLRFKKGDELWR